MSYGNYGNITYPNNYAGNYGDWQNPTKYPSIMAGGCYRPPHQARPYQRQSQHTPMLMMATLLTALMALLQRSRGGNHYNQGQWGGPIYNNGNVYNDPGNSGGETPFPYYNDGSNTTYPDNTYPNDTTYPNNDDGLQTDDGSSLDGGSGSVDNSDDLDTLPSDGTDITDDVPDPVAESDDDVTTVPEETTTDSNGVTVYKDTADKNNYAFTGDAKKIRVEGNEGANIFDVRNLTNSQLTVNSFDADDRIRLNAKAPTEITVAKKEGDTYTIKDKDGNVTTVTIPAGKDVDWLKERFQKADGTPLISGSSINNKPSWVPADYADDFYKENQDRVTINWDDSKNKTAADNSFDGIRRQYVITDKDSAGMFKSDKADETFRFTGTQSSYVFNGNLRANHFEIGGKANKVQIENFDGDDTLLGLKVDNLSLLNDTSANPLGKPNDKGGWNLQFFDKSTGNYVTIDTTHSNLDWQWLLKNAIK